MLSADIGEICSCSHIALNVVDLEKSIEFYLKTLSPLGFRLADKEEGEYARLTNGKNFVIILSPTREKYLANKYHRRATGLDHFAISVASKQIVDEMEKHLLSLNIKTLGEGKIELGYRRGYYCLLFECPDRIMIEIVCHDPFYFSYDN
jgi:catechol 2,3-dioxygenase-like lactoylglutathione lyase family enzyme